MRPRFLILVDSLDWDYNGRVLDEFQTACFARGVDLLVSMGRFFSPTDEFHCSGMPELIGKDTLSAIILPGNIFHRFPESFFRERLSSPFPGIPMAVLGRRTALPDSIHLDIDTAPVFREAVDHLVTVHGCRRLGFIQGPESSEEAAQRYDAFCTALRSHGLPLDPRLVTRGDYSFKKGEAAADLFHGGEVPPPDAVVSANDAMATGYLTRCLARGLRVGEDMRVIGCDDMFQSRISPIPLSTIRQPLALLAGLAVDALLGRLGLRSPEPGRFVPAKLVLRDSCGCRMGTHGTPDLRDYPGTIRKAVEEIGPEEGRPIFRDAFLPELQKDWVARVPLLERWGELLWGLPPGEAPRSLGYLYAREMAGLEEKYLLLRQNISFLVKRVGHILTHPGVDTLSRDLPDILDLLGTDWMVLVLYPDESERPTPATQLPARSTVLRVGKPDGITQEETGSILPSLLSREEGPHSYLLDAIKFDQQRIGAILTRFDTVKRSLLLLLQDYIAQAVHLDQLLEKRRRTEQKLSQALDLLEAYNLELKDQSEKDDLTGLLNRRGFLAVGSRQIEASVRRGRELLVIYCDLDGLKKVNDTFGHDTGDLALKHFAAALVHTFRDGDVLSRLGGDEFVVLAGGIDGSRWPEIQKRMDEALTLETKRGLLPLPLSTSIGVASRMGDGIDDLESLMKLADGRLYGEKRKKRDTPGSGR